MTTDPAQRLKQTVLDGGYCIGCGMCAVVEPERFTIDMNNQGMLEARLRPTREAAASSKSTIIDVEKVCPFGAQSANETTLGTDLFSAPRHRHIGAMRAAWGGHVTAGDFRDSGSSGGMVSYIAHALLTQRMVDAVVHVRPSQQANRLFEFAISRTPEDLLSGAKSRYYPVEMSAVMAEIQRCPGRYALIGLPCFIKAVRLLQREAEWARTRIVYTIGLVCGHLKSEQFAHSLAWQMEIPPDQLRDIDFRVKNPRLSASDYAVTAIGPDGPKTRQVRDMVGTNWGDGTFKYAACDFCDDVFAETADVVMGDAWLPEFVHDGMGDNIIVVRHHDLQALVERAIEAGDLALRTLSPDDLMRSQGGGMRHRRDAIGLRLAVRKRLGDWVPPKRIRPATGLFPPSEKRLQQLREATRKGSFEGFAESLSAGSIDPYVQKMHALSNPLRRFRGRLWERGMNFIRRQLSGIP